MVVLAISLAVTSLAFANDIYIGPAAIGANSGADCADARPVSWFNTAANWGTGSTQIKPGTTVHLCGSITTSLSVQGDGASGNPIVILAESSSSVQLQGTANTCPIIVNNHSHLIFDGGGVGGTNGILAVLNNGSGMAAHNLVSAFCNTTSDGDIEIRNWLLGPFYQHLSNTDTTSSADTETNIFASVGGLSGNLSIHDNVMHDVGVAIFIGGSNLTNSPVINIYNNYIYNIDWALGMAPPGGAHTLSFHDNHVGSTVNWDTTMDVFHHDGIHFYEGAGPSSAGTYVYNNLFDGDWGTCCTTAYIFQEMSPIANYYVFNNVFNETRGNLMPAIENYWPTVGGLYHNTFLCAAGGSTNQAISINSAASNANIENNTFYNCNQFLTFAGSTLPGTVDYNVYLAQGAGGDDAWGVSTGGYDPPLSTWQAACSCDAHSIYNATPTLNVDGSPMTSFPGLSTGANLTSIAKGGLAPLASDTSNGKLRTPTMRPASGAWTVGAFQSALPAPPSITTVTPK